jgi:ABC-type Na+ transport system ATPase subunit NatA
MNVQEYARKQVQITAEENGIQAVIVADERLYIEFPSGKCYELSEKEIKYQAEEYLKSELELIKHS